MSEQLTGTITFLFTDIEGLFNLLRLDLETLPFRARSCDAIWAHTSLLHIPKTRLPQTLKALVKILKPEGALFVALKKGSKEEYLRMNGELLWFSLFEDEEFKHCIPQGLEMIRQQTTQVRTTVFLNYHLIKRPQQ